MKRILALILLAALLCGCADSTGTPDDPAAPISVEADEFSADDTVAMADFALDLLRQQQPGGQNTLISPLSILAALGMTANGAAGETLAQMEEVFGLTANRLCAIMPGLLTGSDQLHLANGIWYRDTGITVYPEFLAACADYYNATAKPTPMDATTREEINAFIEEHTNEMIKDMLDESMPSADAVMLLVNALAFEAEWAVKYTDAANIREGDFFPTLDAPVKTEYMYGEESAYLEDSDAVGFIKPYAGGKYAFAALLPNEGVALEDYVASLDGKTLTKLLEHAANTTVYTALPKFSYDYTTELVDHLHALGMTDAFDPATADFSRMGRADGNLFISRILHKTHIEVGEAGTRAAAATVVQVSKESASRGPADPKYVYLTRPFLYLIIDLDAAQPIFIGTMTNPS